MFKINISTKDGKTYKLEAEAPGLKQKKIGDTVSGQEISPDLVGYELEITGTSDFAGFTGIKGVSGIGLKGKLLTLGKAMHRPPKGDKKKIKKAPQGLRLRKTVRGETISDAIVQINTKVVKEGNKKLSEVFADQNKTEIPAEAPAEEAKPEEKNVETKAPEKTESKEEPPKPAETPVQEKSESVTESPKQKEVSAELAQPEKEPKEQLPEQKEVV